jgi:hypothetical protein
MKRISKMLAVLVLGPGLILAQSSKRTTAHNALEDFKRDKDMASLKKAKEYIDAAAQHPETGVEAKTWFFRGDIYLASYANDLSLESEKHKDVTEPAKRNLLSYANTPVTDLQTAYESYAKVKQLDKKNNYGEEVSKDLFLVQSHFDNKGRADYHSKKAVEAGASFEKCFEISQILGKMDTAILENAAQAYRFGEDMTKAKAMYEKLIALEYGKGKTISALANILINEKDTAAASKLIMKGRQKYPEDMELLKSETNLFLMAHKNKEALANIKKAIEKSPADARLNLIAGTLYDNLANPKDAKGENLPVPAEFSEYFAQSELYYKKAIELKPDLFEALYNIGALYNNQGVVLFNKANSMKDAKAAAVESKKAEDYFKNALPYLEKAHVLNPTDMTTMNSLKKIYAMTEQQDKYEAIKKEIQAAGAK